MESPPKRSCSVVSPCNPLSVWSVGPQIALGIDPGKPSEEIACAEAREALSNRPGIAAAETANNLATSCLFIIPPSCKRDCSASDARYAEQIDSMFHSEKRKPSR